MQLFKTLEQDLGYLNTNQMKAIKRAYLFAHQAHQHQKRHSGEPYIIHPVAVARILAQMHLDTETLIAALLHDVVEDTVITDKQISKIFGKQIAQLVDGVSKLSQIECKSRTDAKAKNLRKMLLAVAQEIRVMLIKLADRLHNMRTLSPCPLDKRKRIALETLSIFSPIAKRLGMHEMSVELEDLSFQTLYPKRYEILKQVLKRLHRKRKYSLKQIKNILEKQFKKCRTLQCKVLAREKHLYSIYKKMCDKKIPFSAIYDVYAFRIILNDDDVSMCYRVLGLMHQLYKPIPNGFKDYIATPKQNGYQSLHTVLFGPSVIPIEIQIRTKQMEHQANYGIASHWIYKTNEPDISQSQLVSQRWMQNLLELHQKTVHTDNASEFIKNFEIKLFPNEIYVFTTKGDVLELPKGASVLDFAYAIHSDIGHHCYAAKIDHKFVPLFKTLQNGQTIEIMASNKKCI